MDNNKFKYHYSFIILIFLFFSCGRVFHKSDFNISNNSFQAHSTLNINGFYIDTLVIGERTIPPLYPRKICVSPMVLFGDGTVIKIHGAYCRPWFEGQQVKPLIEELIKQIEFEIEKNDLTMKTEPEMWDWGMYRIEQNEIKMQVYKNHQGDYYLVDYWGEVKNDTIIQLQLSTDRAKKILKVDINEEYIFCKFDMRPDSSNYIKKHLKEFGKKK